MSDDKHRYRPRQIDDDPVNQINEPAGAIADDTIADPRSRSERPIQAVLVEHTQSLLARWHMHSASRPFQPFELKARGQRFQLAASAHRAHEHILAARFTSSLERPFNEVMSEG